MTDLIRREDALKAVNAVFNGYPNHPADAIRTLPAVPTDAVRLRQLLDAIVDEYNDQVHGPILHSVVAARSELEGEV